MYTLTIRISTAYRPPLVGASNLASLTEAGGETRICIYIYIYIYMYVCIGVHVCMYIYIYTHTQ